MNVLTILSDGLFGLTGTSSLVVALCVGLILTQCEIMAVTLYLHREVSHGSVKFHPAVRNFFRTVNWLSSSMIPWVWAAIHRWHHAHVETVEDPHSPLFKRFVFPFGVFHYVIATRDAQMLAQYKPTARCPDDWLERNLFGRFPFLGMPILFVVLAVLFGIKVGGILWLVQVLLIPVFGAGVINGLGHSIGYRNGDTPDTSHNLYPIAVFIGGEELHNNHHLKPESPKFSLRPGEVDIGWGVIQVLRYFGLATASPLVGKLPTLATGQSEVSDETAYAFWRFRFLVMKRFIRETRMDLKHRSRAEGEPRQSLLARLQKRMRDGGWFTEDIPSEGDSEVTRLQDLRTRLARLCMRAEGKVPSREEIHEWLSRVQAEGGDRYTQFVVWVKSLRFSTHLA